MVDLTDGGFVEDIEAVEQAEREAHRARYGKLEPALFERLETMKPDDEVPVAIWVAGRPKRSEEELYAALAARYPEAQAALERSGNPFDVGDYELGNEIEAEYVRMLEADTQERIQPLVRYLEGQGYDVTTLGGLPAGAITLPKALILELVERTDVGAVYLGGKEAQTESDSAVSGNRAPAVLERAFRGSGGPIAAAVVWGLALLLIYLSRRAGGVAGKRLLWAVLVMATALTLPLLYLAACKPKETELSFETLVHDNLGYFGATYASMDLMVATDVAEAQQIADTLSPERPGMHLEEIADVDYEEYLVVVAYFGTRVYSESEITIERITQVERVVNVIVSTVEPTAGDRVIVHPIHIVKIKRADLLAKGRLSFNLWKGGEVILTREHFVP